MVYMYNQHTCIEHMQFNVFFLGCFLSQTLTAHQLSSYLCFVSLAPLKTMLSAFENPWLKLIDLLPTSRIYCSEKVISTHKVHHEVSTVKLSVLTYN